MPSLFILCGWRFLPEREHLLISFFPRYNTFASAGSDGMVSIWDHESKKRLRQFPNYNSPVSSISFSHDGTKIAIAVCDVWDEGEEASKQAKRPSIFVRTLGDEVKVRVSPLPLRLDC